MIPREGVESLRLIEEFRGAEGVIPREGVESEERGLLYEALKVTGDPERGS